VVLCYIARGWALLVGAEQSRSKGWIICKFAWKANKQDTIRLD